MTSPLQPQTQLAAYYLNIVNRKNGLSHQADIDSDAWTDWNNDWDNDWDNSYEQDEWSEDWDDWGDWNNS